MVDSVLVRNDNSEVMELDDFLVNITGLLTINIIELCVLMLMNFYCSLLTS